MEKSQLKLHLLFLQTYSVCLKKCTNVKIVLKKSYTEKKTNHTPSGYSFLTNFLFDSTKSKLACYKGKDCMERFSKDLRGQEMKITDYEKTNDTAN